MKAKIQKDSIFRIGKVISVEGRLVKVEVAKEKNGSHLLYKGKLVKNIAVNSYIKITKGYTKIIGKVEGEFVVEDKEYSVKKYTSDRKKIKRILNLSLIGFITNKGFERGLKELPLINNECFLLDEKEFESVLDFVKPDDIGLTLGVSSNDRNQKIEIGVNSLFASHIGIFGNTGSGKSYTLSKIYSELFKKYSGSENFNRNAKFLMFDFNGEYNGVSAISSDKKVYNLTTKKESQNDVRDKLIFTEKDMLNIDLFSIMANASEKTQKPFIKRALEFYQRISDSDDSREYIVNILKKRVREVLQMADKEKSFLLLDYVIQVLPRKYDDDRWELDLKEDLQYHNTSNEFMWVNNGQKHYLRQSPEKITETKVYSYCSEYVQPTNFIERINHILYLQLIYDVISNRAENNHVAPAINKLKSFQRDIGKVIEIREDGSDFWEGKSFCVINLDKSSMHIKKMIPLLVSYKLYNEHKEIDRETTAKSLNIIVDEAHNILSFSSDRESEDWKDYRLETFEEIIKEGRKFGVFLTVASQRPSDISPTIVSQLHNFLLHRLINNNDIKAVEKTVSYLDKVSFESLSILPTGTCVFAGLAAQVPVVVEINKIDSEFVPNNKTMSLVDAWK